jgi:hypothetical protein
MKILDESYFDEGFLDLFKKKKKEESKSQETGNNDNYNGPTLTDEEKQKISRIKKILPIVKKIAKDELKSVAGIKYVSLSEEDIIMSLDDNLFEIAGFDATKDPSIKKLGDGARDQEYRKAIHEYGKILDAAIKKINASIKSFLFHKSGEADTALLIVIRISLFCILESWYF